MGQQIMHAHAAVRCEHCEELEEQIRQLRVLIAPQVYFPSAWKLTMNEIKVLRCFLKRTRVSRDMILSSMYGAGEAEDERVVDVYIGRIRKHLKLSMIPIKFEPEYGFGYRISEEHRAILRSHVEETS